MLLGMAAILLLECLSLKLLTKINKSLKTRASLEIYEDIKSTL